LPAQFVDQRFDVADAILQGQREPAGLQQMFGRLRRVASRIRIGENDGQVGGRQAGMVELRRQPDDMRTANAFDRNSFVLDFADVILARIDQRDVATCAFEQTAVDAAHRTRSDHVNAHDSSESSGKRSKANFLPSMPRSL
jgi:hypothetical protein